MPIMIVPPGMEPWVTAEAAKLGLTFMAQVREVDPTDPGHDFEEELEIPPPSPIPHLRLV